SPTRLLSQPTVLIHLATTLAVWALGLPAPALAGPWGGGCYGVQSGRDFEGLGRSPARARKSHRCRDSRGGSPRCPKCPGVTHDEICDALRGSIEELQGEVAAADRVLKILEPMVKEREGKLPGLPGGPPLKH